MRTHTNRCTLLYMTCVSTCHVWPHVQYQNMHIYAQHVKCHVYEGTCHVKLRVGHMYVSCIYVDDFIYYMIYYVCMSCVHTRV